MHTLGLQTLSSNSLYTKSVAATTGIGCWRQVNPLFGTDLEFLDPMRYPEIVERLKSTVFALLSTQ